LAAAFLLNIVPITVLGVYTPFAVRLMVQFSSGTGRLVGSVSAMSTFGSIFGTLGTTFFLVPMIGSRDITTLFGVIAMLSAASLGGLTWIWRDAHREQGQFMGVGLGGGAPNSGDGGRS
jgi:predicted membrane-bound spermidine synthase